MNKAVTLTKRETQMAELLAWGLAKREDLDKILLPKKIEIAGRRMRRMSASDCGVGCGLEQG